jgi:hypothetical protein
MWCNTLHKGLNLGLMSFNVVEIRLNDLKIFERIEIDSLIWWIWLYKYGLTIHFNGDNIANDSQYNIKYPYVPFQIERSNIEPGLLRWYLTLRGMDQFNIAIAKMTHL